MKREGQSAERNPIKMRAELETTRLKEQIRQVQSQVRNLGRDSAKIAVGFDTRGVSEAKRQIDSLKASLRTLDTHKTIHINVDKDRNLDSKIKGMGGDAGKGFMSGFRGGMGGAGGAGAGAAAGGGGGGLGGLITGGIMAALPAVPVLMGTAGAAGAIAFGAALLMGSKKNAGPLRATWRGTMKSIKESLQDVATPLLKPIEAGLQQMAMIVRQVSPELRQMFAAAAPLVKPLVDSIGNLVKGILPGFISMLKQSGPAVRAFAVGIGLLARGLGGFMAALGPAMRASGQFFISLMHSMGMLLVYLGRFIAAWTRAFSPVMGQLVRTLVVIIGQLLHAITPLLPSVARLASLLIGMLGNAIKLMISGLSVFINLFVRLPGPVRSAIIAITAAAIAWRVLNAVMKANPIMAVIGLVLLLAGIIVKYHRQIETVAVAVWRHVWSFMKQVWQDLSSTAVRIWNDIANFFKRIWNDISSFFENLLNRDATFFKTVWNGVSGFARRLWNDISNFFKSIWNSISDFFKNALNTDENVFRTVWNAISNTARSVWNSIKNFFVGAWDWLSGKWHSVWNGMKDSFSSVIHGIANTARTVWSDIVSIFRTPINAVIGFYDNGIARIGNDIIHAFGLKNASLPTIPKLASGGHVRGPGGPREDKVPAMLSNGEFVVNAAATTRHRALLEHINSMGAGTSRVVGGMPHLAGGGSVPGAPVGPGAGGPLAPSPNQGKKGLQPNKPLSPAALAKKLVAGAVSAVADPIIDALEKGINGSIGKVGAIGAPIAGGADKVLEAFKSWITGKDAAAQPKGGGPGGKGFPGTAVGPIQQYAQSQLKTMGWGSDQMGPLIKLWNQESGWNPNAVNASSGAYGIPQALGHGHPYALGDYKAQIAWGFNYIKGRYGNPAGAWAHEQANNWYASGGPILEPIIGVGQKTGQGYMFGENGPEWVSPGGAPRGATGGAQSIQLSGQATIYLNDGTRFTAYIEDKAAKVFDSKVDEARQSRRR